MKRILYSLIAFAALQSVALAQSVPLILKSGRITQAGTADSLTIRGTGHVYTQNGATIHRLQDRLFTGLMTVNDGAFPNVTKDWLSTLETGWGNSVGYPVFSMLATLTNNDAASGYAILGGAQTLHLGLTGAAIGVQGHAIANQASNTSSAWGFYSEAHRVVSGAGSAYGIEANTVAHVVSISPTPNQQGNTVSEQLACGGEYAGFTQFSCSAASQIAPNGGSFITGINVLRGAIVGTNPAIQLPTGNPVAFYDATGHVGGTIGATFTTVNTANIQFDDSGMLLTSTGGASIARFSQNATAANYLSFAPGNAGSAVAVSATGSDTDVSLNLTPKGAGAVVIGGAMKLPNYTVATLPTCNSALKGGMAYVTDATAPTYNAALTGGGTVGVPVACNGSAWSSH